MKELGGRIISIRLVALLVVVGLALLSLSNTNLIGHPSEFLTGGGGESTIIEHTKAIFDLDAFIDTFEAARPGWTEKCKLYLRSPAEYNVNRTSYINWMWEFSQYNQDWILFTNWLHTRGRNGFYVESGANSPMRVSNTAFYDYCMGWQGLCVEPTQTYLQEIRDTRTCHLETVCLSNKEEIINMVGENPTRDEVNDTIPVKCERLDTLLQKYNVSHVDLWSLDIEGFEMNALRGLGDNFPDILLMEQQDMGGDACSQMAIDYRLTARGYDKHRFVSDGIYVHRNNGPLKVPNSTALDEYVRQLEDTRCKNVGKELFFFDQE